MDLHIGHVLAYLLGFEVDAFLLAFTLTLIRWVRYYQDLSNGWAVATGEGRLTTFLYFVGFNVLGFVVLAVRVVLAVLHIQLAW